MRLSAYCYTNQGGRDHNEDSVRCCAGQGAFVLADGLGGHGSGEVMIGFTTANRVLAEPKEKLLSQTVIHESLINLAFQAAAEAAHEAILNSMVCAERTAGLDGRIYCSLAEFLPQLFIQ